MTPTVDQINALQSSGIISDECVQWSDVCTTDQARAIAWLNLEKEMI